MGPAGFLERRVRVVLVALCLGAAGACVAVAVVVGWAAAQHADIMAAADDERY